MCQVGWTIWKRKKYFASLQELKDFALVRAEKKSEKYGYGCRPIAEYEERGGNRYLLHSITFWSDSVHYQVQASEVERKLLHLW